MLSVSKSINQYKSIFILGLITLGSFAVSNPAKAATFESKSWTTDAEFISILNKGDFKELFVAEGRIGNNSLNTGERELKINGDVQQGAPVSIQDDFVWGNGNLWDFTLEYTGSKVNYTLGGKLLSSMDFNGSASDIFLRTTATTNSTMTLSNLLFNNEEMKNSQGQVISNVSSVGTSSRDIDYLQISDITSPFTITGKAAMSWTATQPMRSNLAFQIKVGNSPKKSVPEPGTLGAVFAVGIIGTVATKRKKVAKIGLA
ncbi:PEP-CTERM sorting domain-containing protein [Komarekiella sp. 'clone 1']|uniref:PEP-CTERM sorting domain-containing protein n=1 Tax=Komarekiella delphini-convector SJRDD-AB1 TaxID=2593771 RepID=A0AA40VPW7_9NOST|nr:choice-of-anchor W domain-containing protein [Komarekiella delphini-convector]MBD6615717.1 PEP-CTERM sorting domain-containing protein [Komarekiella delphini-convector SJRDD-AB1]